MIGDTCHRRRKVLERFRRIGDFFSFYTSVLFVVDGIITELLSTLSTKLSTGIIFTIYFTFIYEIKAEKCYQKDDNRSPNTNFGL